jgi:sugar phosphate isomerase/epimerase
VLRIGFVNACMAEKSLEEQIEWAASNGFGAIELHGAPNTCKIDLQKVSQDKDEAARIKQLAKANEVIFSGFMWGGHHLHHNTEKREFSQARLKAMITAAVALDIEVVSTFIGRDPALPLKENIELAKKTWTELLPFAKEYGVKIAIENCPMMYEWPGGLNIAYAPETWEGLFEALDPKGEILYLNFDPSHLFWLGIDYIAALKDFASRVVRVQAKDAEILPDKLNKVGILGDDWWRYRLPGLGQVNWSKFINTVYELGLAERVQAISIEHEDPVWEGSPDKVQRGLKFTRQYLSNFIL